MTNPVDNLIEALSSMKSEAASAIYQRDTAIQKLQDMQKYYASFWSFNYGLQVMSTSTIIGFTFGAFYGLYHDHKNNNQAGEKQWMDYAAQGAALGGGLSSLFIILFASNSVLLNAAALFTFSSSIVILHDAYKEYQMYENQPFIINGLPELCRNVVESISQFIESQKEFAPAPAGAPH